MAGLVGALLLVPAVTQPTLAIGLVAAVAGLWLASRSIAIPVALSFAPPLVDAIYGSDPLPKGGVTFLFAAWIGLAVLLALARGASTSLVLTPAAICTLILFALMVIRLGPSLAEPYGSKKLQQFLADNLMVLIGGTYIGASLRDSRRFFTAMLSISALISILLVLDLASGSQQIVAGRYSISNQEYPIELGRASADGMLLAIYTMVAGRTLLSRMGAAAVFPAAAISLIAAGSRGPVLAFLVALLSLLALAAGSGRTRQGLTRVAVIIVAAIVIVPLVVPGSAVGRALSTIFGGSSGLSTNGRAGLWSLAISSFSAHPLLGVGTGSFAALQIGELYPHNLFLEAASELGVVGLLATIGFVISPLRRMIHAWRLGIGPIRLELALVIALFLAALVNALFSGAMPDNRELWLWAGVGLGLAVRSAGGARTRPRTGLGYGAAR